MYRRTHILILACPLALAACVDLAPLTLRVDGHDSQLQTLQSTNTALRTKQGETDEQLRQALATLDDSNKTLAAIHSEIAGLEQRDKDVDEKIDTLARQKELTEVVQEMNGVQREQKSHGTRLDDIETELPVTTSLARQLQAEHGGRLDTIEAELEGTTALARTLQEKLSTMIDKVEAAQDSVQKVVSTLISQLLDMKDLMDMSSENIDSQITNLRASVISDDSPAEPTDGDQ